MSIRGGGGAARETGDLRDLYDKICSGYEVFDGFKLCMKTYTGVMKPFALTLTQKDL